MVQVDFSLAVGGGKLNASAVVPTGETTLKQLLPVLQELSSSIVDATVQTVRSEGHEISCRAGCGACCRQLVPLSLFEAGVLAEWVRSLPQEQQAVLETRFNTALQALRNGGVLERLAPRQAPAPGSPEQHQLAVDYFRQGVPCPFLQNESCSIHPIRPLICREYLVTTPAEFCAAPTAETVRPVPMPVKLSNALFHMGAELTDEGQGWMPLVFLLAWAKLGRDVGTAYHASGPELLRMVVLQLATNDTNSIAPVALDS